MDTLIEIQHAALSLAVKTYASRPGVIDVTEVLETATAFAQWMGNPVMSLTIRPDSLTYEQGSGESAPTKFNGGTVELKDTKQVRLTLDIHDLKGFDTAEPAGVTLSWTSDATDIVVLQPSEDGTSCLAVAGVPGTALVQISDGTRTGSLAFDVTAGDVNSITIVAGEPEDQPGTV